MRSRIGKVYQMDAAGFKSAASIKPRLNSVRFRSSVRNRALCERTLWQPTSILQELPENKRISHPET